MKRILFLTLTFFVIISAHGQTTILIRHSDRDTAYIRDFYRRHLIVRAYESTKFNNFKLIDEPDKIIYKPNDHNNAGLGFNYRFISLNLGFYLPFAGKNRDVYGKTHDFDLQTHIYVHKFIVDLYAQFYKGYYLANSNAMINNYSHDGVLVRPDIDTRDISLVVQYVFNDKHFSYNAPFYQNERQKKSAGSFLLGGGIYHADVKGDSALMPSNLSYNNFFDNFRFNRTNNNSIAFTAGYAYTLVIKQLFFLSASLSGGAGINESTLTDTHSGEKVAKYGPELNVSEKFAAGYNSDNYFAGITYIRLVTEDHTPEQHTWQEVNTGNFRITIARRFRLKKTLLPKSDLIHLEDY